MENNFPLELHNALIEIAVEYGLKLQKETHYEAINRELRWFKKSAFHRLNFEFISNESLIYIVYYVDKFPIFPRFLNWCHDFIPMFPYFAKIMWRKLPGIPLGLTRNEYKERIKETLKTIL